MRRCPCIQTMGAGFLLLLGLFLGGCAPAPPEAYVLRLADALELPPPRLPAPRAWPRPRERQAPVPEEKGDLLDFLALQRCGLGAVLGARNGPLGRVMDGPERLRYELRFRAGAERCLSTLEGEARERLEALLARKQDSWPAVLWNGTLGSAAWAQLFGAHGEAWAPPPASEGAAALAALEPLRARMVALGPSALDVSAEAFAAAENPAAWHRPWEALAQQRYPGVALHQLQRLTGALEGAARLLEQREGQRSLCPQGRPTPRAKRVNAVFLRYYGEALQPAMAELERGLRPWLEATGFLWAQVQGGAPVAARPALEGFLDPRAPGPWQAYEAARDRHTARWQAVLGACQLMPGSSAPSS